MIAKKFAGATLATGLLLSACGDIKNFDDRPGDIYAGQEATVLENWHSTRTTGKHGPSGYVLYLVTEDCEDGTAPAEGAAIADSCESTKHRVEPSTYLNSADGDLLTWEGKSSTSEVIEHRRGRQYYYARVHDFGLLVEQCARVAGTETQETCVEDIVEVDADTWYNFRPGDTVVFEGDRGEVVSG